MKSWDELREEVGEVETDHDAELLNESLLSEKQRKRRQFFGGWVWVSPPTEPIHFYSLRHPVIVSTGRQDIYPYVR